MTTLSKDAAKNLDDVLRLELETLDLSIRAKHCLANADIRFVGDLIQKTERELRKIKNFGKGTLREIKELLVTLTCPEHLQLGTRIDSWPSNRSLKITPPLPSVHVVMTPWPPPPPFSAGVLDVEWTGDTFKVTGHKGTGHTAFISIRRVEAPQMIPRNVVRKALIGLIVKAPNGALSVITSVESLLMQTVGKVAQGSMRLLLVPFIA